LILVAEDSKVARDVLEQFLKKVKANFEIYPNGAGVIERVKELDPSLIGMHEYKEPTNNWA